jgi:hypothetical protein
MKLPRFCKLAPWALSGICEDNADMNGQIVLDMVASNEIFCDVSLVSILRGRQSFPAACKPAGQPFSWRQMGAGDAR